MFLSLSKTLARFGGFRLGVGVRMTKKNSIGALLLIMFLSIFKMMWYLMIVCFWMFYAVGYGAYWCIKKIPQTRKGRSTDENQAS